MQKFPLGAFVLTLIGTGIFPAGDRMSSSVGRVDQSAQTAHWKSRFDGFSGTPVGVTGVPDVKQKE
jgi:hypothetical protein